MAYSPILLPGFNEEEYAALPVEKEDENAVVAQGNELDGVKGAVAEGMEAEGENLPNE